MDKPYNHFMLIFFSHSGKSETGGSEDSNLVALLALSLNANDPNDFSTSGFAPNPKPPFYECWKLLKEAKPVRRLCF